MIVRHRVVVIGQKLLLVVVVGVINIIMQLPVMVHGQNRVVLLTLPKATFSGSGMVKLVFLKLNIPTNFNTFFKTF